MRRRASRALAELGAAAPLGAVCLLAANDHQFKHLFHNTLTGKLSDVAICFLLPLMVSAALGLVCGWPGRRRLAVGAVVATLVFTLLELSDPAGALFVRATRALGLGGGTLTRDPTDLLALALVPLAVAYGRRRLAAAERGPGVWRSATGALVMATGSLALMATSSSAPPTGTGTVGDCSEWSAPVVFMAEAGCGPGGLIVVEPIVDNNSGNFIGIQISNAAALGLPRFTHTLMPKFSAGTYEGGACPFTLDLGGWEVETFACDVACTTTRTCIVTADIGALSFGCGRGDGEAACTSRLTVVP